MTAIENEGPRKSSGFTRKSSPGAYALVEVTEAEPVKVTAEERIEALKSFHLARTRLAVLAGELSSAPASDIVPGVTAAYVEAMRQCLQVLLLNADVAEGL